MGAAFYSRTYLTMAAVSCPTSDQPHLRLVLPQLVLDHVLEPNYNWRVVVVLASGSFNPVHKSHVGMLQGARASFAGPGQIIIGYLAPSSDRYVSQKMGQASGANRHYSLQERSMLCHEAIQDAEEFDPTIQTWLGVIDWGWASGPKIRQHLLETFGRISLEMPHITFEVQLVYGADFFARCRARNFDSLICVMREGSSAEERTVVQRLQRDGLKVIQTNACPVMSSSRVRQLLHNGNWDQLSQLVGPRVLRKLRVL
eukprot:c8495_g1_i2.p1 GENE.c8495_g1_i2~~c8495_g1_i2.p1  ORF type:complete len:257 (+),score=24.53 c8495_g1_i2:1-771(+)